MSNPEVPFVQMLFATIPKAVYSVYCLGYVTLKKLFNLN